jgi:hypothetical protein
MPGAVKGTEGQVQEGLRGALEKFAARKYSPARLAPLCRCGSQAMMGCGYSAQAGMDFR